MWRRVLVRRFKFAFILCTLVLCLTGCGLEFKSPVDDIKNAWEEHKDEKEDKKAKKEAEKAAKKAEKEAKKAAKQAEYDSLYSSELGNVKDSLYESGSWIGKATANVASWFSGDSAADMYAKYHSKDMDAAVHSKANDKRLDEEAQNKADKKERMDHFIKFIPLIIIVVIVVLLVVLFIFLSSHSEKKVVKVKREVPKRTEPPQVDQVNVKYQRVLRDNCSKLGLDYEQTLAQYGGDVKTAVDATNLQLYKQ